MYLWPKNTCLYTVAHRFARGRSDREVSMPFKSPSHSNSHEECCTLCNINATCSMTSDAVASVTGGLARSPVTSDPFNSIRCSCKPNATLRQLERRDWWHGKVTCHRCSVQCQRIGILSDMHCHGLGHTSLSSLATFLSCCLFMIGHSSLSRIACAVLGSCDPRHPQICFFLAKPSQQLSDWIINETIIKKNINLSKMNF